MKGKQKKFDYCGKMTVVGKHKVCQKLRKQQQKIIVTHFPLRLTERINK
jgi:hypothetical protein